MFYEEWMSFLRDEAKISQVAIPGTHNSGTYKMFRFARCQSDGLYEQYRHGVRYFDFRFHLSRNGKLVFEHGVSSGSSLEEGLADIKKMIENNDSEFFIFKLHHPERENLIGNIGRCYKYDFELVNSVFKKYIEPEKYAFTDFDDISKVTMGDIRRSGKRYILSWDNEGIDYSVNTPVFDPWQPDIHGLKTDAFFEASLGFFNDVPEKCIFCYQIQRTPGVGTEEGLKCPDTLEKDVKMNFHKLINKIAGDEFLLGRVNVMAGDFMTDGHYKSNMILRLNLAKNIIDSEKAELFDKITRV